MRKNIHISFILMAFVIGMFFLGFSFLVQGQDIVTTGDNDPPYVRITKPGSGDVVKTESMTMKAIARNVDSIKFIANGKGLGEARKSGDEWSLKVDVKKNLPNGDYDLEAKFVYRGDSGIGDRTHFIVDIPEEIVEEPINTNPDLTAPDQGQSSVTTTDPEPEPEPSPEPEPEPEPESEPEPDMTSDTDIDNKDDDKENQGDTKDFDVKVESRETINRAGNDYQKNRENLFWDSDNDGIPDGEEERIGTNPNSPDSDGDGYGDEEEILNGYNPLKPATDEGGDKVSYEEPKDKGEESEDYSVRNVTIQNKDDGGIVTRIEGTGPPNSYLNVFVYSEKPIVITVKTDSDGNWVYDLEDLEDGDHEVYVAVTDNEGKITKKSRSIPFVKTAQAVTISSEENVVEASINPAQRSKRGMFIYAIAIAASFLLISLIVIGIVTSRKRKNNAQSY